MRIAWKRWLPLSSMLVFPLLGMLYHRVNRPTDVVYSVMTDLDRALPLVKLFVLPYTVWIFYIYVCLVYFLAKDPNIYYRSLLTYTICTLICYLIYTVFQTTVPRPYLTGDDVFTRMLQLVYNRDLPYNCFPSIHCFSSYMVVKALYTSGFRNRVNTALIGGMSTLIILSTLFIKQHAIMDAFAAFLLVEIVYGLLVRIEKTAVALRGETFNRPGGPAM